MLELKIRHLSACVGGKTILKDIDTSFTQGEKVAVIGRNGAGKTTFIRAIAGLQSHNGTVDLLKNGKKLSRSAVAYLPQLEKITSSLTTFETVLLGLTQSLNWKIRPDELEKVQAVLQKLKLSSLSDQPVARLSGGQKQMVFLAQAFVSQPSLLLLDEPTSALDIRHQLVVMETVSRYCAETGAIALFVIHDLMLASRYSDTVLFLNQGLIHAFDRPEEVVSSDIIDPVYRIESLIEKNSKGLTTLTPLQPL